MEAYLFKLSLNQPCLKYFMASQLTVLRSTKIMSQLGSSAQ
jgi:hypothetical protein